MRSLVCTGMYLFEFSGQSCLDDALAAQEECKASAERLSKTFGEGQVVLYCGKPNEAVVWKKEAEVWGYPSAWIYHIGGV